MNKTNIFKKCIFVFLTILILMVCVIILVNFYVKETSSGNILNASKLDSLKDYDCIVVLGCGVLPDGSPSAMLSDRLKRAIEIYNSGAAPKIIMSGDHGRENYDEVNVMKKYALDHDVREEDIFLDHAGFSTYETMYRAKEVFEAEKIIVVTQKYHLYRSVYIANKLGLKVCGVDSDYRAYSGQINRDLREIAARFKDFVTCIIKPKPTFLGEVIPVSGDGRKSWD